MAESNEPIEIPAHLESLRTLTFLGLHIERAKTIWDKWQSINRSDLDMDFGTWARKHLEQLVNYEKCDIGEPGVDWRPALNKIGADDKLADAIAGQPGDEHDSVRLNKSAAESEDSSLQYQPSPLSDSSCTTPTSRPLLESWSEAQLDRVQLITISLGHAHPHVHLDLPIDWTPVIELRDHLHRDAIIDVRAGVGSDVTVGDLKRADTIEWQLFFRQPNKYILSMKDFTPEDVLSERISLFDRIIRFDDDDSRDEHLKYKLALAVCPNMTAFGEILDSIPDELSGSIMEPRARAPAITCKWWPEILSGRMLRWLWAWLHADQAPAKHKQTSSTNY
ncbi:hypothetical protein Slin15195_G037450 [Septoria linicola]|uniref:Uncharacterized protein n=1 Tax=Septoria linicola TaxID=215465 RepID=A0A9Q9ATF5_9PEZI|nr:hypothetical protein Slin14017_G118860 [Septoria linicola]USW50426.1 hypothetical protein Slin15195_G037450 [Septoria linicola]